MRQRGRRRCPLNVGHDTLIASNVESRTHGEAKLWSARRRELAVREQEREAFERWRASDPRHADAYAKAERLWERLAILQQSQKLAAVVPKPLNADATSRTP